MKKIVATGLLLSMLSLNIMPALALDSNTRSIEASVQATSEKPRRHFFWQKKKNDNLQYKYDYINLEWWNSFNDDYLTSYIKQAIEQNHDVKASTLATQEYYQAMKMQFSQELPTIGVGFAPGFGKMPGSTSLTGAFAVPIFASYELDIYRKNHDKTKAAKKTYEASLQDERSAHISIASAVGTTYLNIVNLDRMIQLQQEIVDLREDLYNLEKLRYEEGLSSSMDVVNSEKGYVYAQNDLIEYKKLHYKLLNQFAVLVGETPNDEFCLARKTFDELTYDKEIPNEISTEVITNRPDYKKAELNVEKAGLDAKVARKELLPSINLGGLALFNSSNFGSIFTTRNTLGGFGGLIGTEIFAGGRKIANLKLKKATYERILENYQQTNIKSIQEVNDALYVLKSDDEHLQKLTQQYNLELVTFGLNALKYQEGVLSKYDLLRYQENLLTLEKQLNQYKTERLTDFIGLYKSVGSQL